MSLFEPMLYLLALHFLCDYAWQGDWMAKAKAPGVINERIWGHVLTGHAIIHAAAVYLVLGIWWLAVAEFVVHWLTDFTKIKGWISYNADQSVHIISKLAWLTLAVTFAQ